MTYTITIDRERDGEEACLAHMFGGQLLRVLHQLDSDLRNRVKYPREDVSEERVKGLQEARDLLWDLIAEYSVGGLME